MANNLCSLWAPCSELSRLGLILRYCRVEMLHNFLTRDPTFSFCMEPHKLCGRPCLDGSLPQDAFLSRLVYTLRMGAITKQL